MLRAVYQKDLGSPGPVGWPGRGGKRVGLLITTETAGNLPAKIQPDYLEVLGSRAIPADRCLPFDALRNCDRHHLDLVYAESIPEKDIGLAVMNRLLKAAGYRVIRV